MFVRCLLQKASFVKLPIFFLPLPFPVLQPRKSKRTCHKQGASDDTVKLIRSPDSKKPTIRRNYTRSVSANSQL